MLGPFATASRRYIAIHQVSLLSHASYSYSAGSVRFSRQQRQRVTEGTAMAPWNGPKKSTNLVVLSALPVVVAWSTDNAENIESVHSK